MKNKKRLVLSLLALATVAFIGGVIAYSTDRSIIENIFGLATYRTVNTETFTSPTDWSACQEIPKTVTLKNESTVPIAARVKYEESWIASNHTTELPLVNNGVRMAVVKLHSPDKWVLNEDDGYYYYYHLLEPGEVTDSFLESVTLDCGANLGTDGFNQCTTANGQTVCTTPDNDYAGAIYTLRAVLDSLQGNVAEEEWDYHETLTAEATLLAGASLANRVGLNTQVIKAGELPENFPEGYQRDASVDAGGLRISTESSEKPVYTWTADEYRSWGGEINNDKYQDNTLYYYTEASKLYYNPNMQGFLSYSGAQLNDMSFYNTIDASKITDLSMAFQNMNRSDFSFLSSWDVSNVENMYRAFVGSGLHDLTDLLGWRLKSVKNMNSAFSGMGDLETLNGAQNWFSDGSVAENLGVLFAFDSSLADISAISGWNVATVKDFNSMFQNDAEIINVAPLGAWRMVSATTIMSMFNGCTKIEDAASLEDWASYLPAGVDKSSAFTNVPTPYPSWY